jgi:hypothetical protein
VAAKKPRKKTSGLPDDAMDKPDEEGQELADELGEQPAHNALPADPFRNRKAVAASVDLGPDSLSGSYFHRIENGIIVWEGQVVAEVQAGIYLCTVTNGLEGVTEQTNAQVLMDLVHMVAKDVGYEWRFFDTEEAAADARRQYDALRKLREEVN